MKRGRPRKENPEEVLKKCSRIFWENGYDGTSMNELVEATNMAKPGLYANFGNKKELFDKSLDCYFKEYAEPLLQDLYHPEDSLKKSVKRFLQSIIAFSSDPKKPGGCFIVNSLIEKSKDFGCTEQTNAMAERFRRQSFLNRFEQAKSQGRLPSDTDVAQLADFFTAQVIALSVMARSGTDPATLNNLIDVSLKTLPNNANNN